MTKLTPQEEAIFRDCLSKNPILQKVREVSEDSTPEPSVESDSTNAKDVYALRAAEASGWRKAIRYIFSELPSDRVYSEDSPFKDTSIN